MIRIVFSVLSLPRRDAFAVHLLAGVVLIVALLQLLLVGTAGSLFSFLQSVTQLVCFPSQYVADILIFRQEFRVFADYAADIWRCLYVV
jgi:hypothetical protein